MLVSNKLCVKGDHTGCDLNGGCAKKFRRHSIKKSCGINKCDFQIINATALNIKLQMQLQLLVFPDHCLL